jgi:hypothetical protein
MGEEIRTSQYKTDDFNQFEKELKNETTLLSQWFKENHFSSASPVAGFELESWLVDEQLRPAPINELFLKQLNEPLASPELAKFNIEFNSTPRPLNKHVFSAMHAELVQLWRKSKAVAQALESKLVMIGILPTVHYEDLNLANMSSLLRYRALNREVIHLRKGKPLVFDINGEEHLRVTHRNVMLESVATSFQIHIQVNQDNAAQIYNTSLLLSAPMIALSTNSPFLFGKNLWSETRIPVFEQAVSIGGFEAAAFGPIRRVTLGSGFVRESLMELFHENVEHYPILLPEHFSDPIERLRHLRLHNGTIWRWNRPLIGFDEDGSPHLRIEHRVVPAGPSITDTIANAAFYYGVLFGMCSRYNKIETRIEFDKVRDNLYRTARFGMRTQINWLDQTRLPVKELLQQLIPFALSGWLQLGISEDDQHSYITVIQDRIESGMTGSKWQRAFIAKYGKDFSAMLSAYIENQESGLPVSHWII